MRNAWTLIALGTVLAGCLSGEGSDADAGDNTANDNNRPSISGLPRSAVTINDDYTFRPFAADLDGDDLTFEISNKPSWANFSTNSGVLSGRPSLGDIGTYGGIRITVTDGKDSASLQDFAIDVVQNANGTVTLSWLAPTENEDGTMLQDLAGYNIYYGFESGNYEYQVRVDNPSITTYMVENLLPGQYYFAATSFNTTGVESAFSGEAIRTVN